MTAFHHRSGTELAAVLGAMWAERERNGDPYALARRGYLQAEAEARAFAGEANPIKPEDMLAWVNSVAYACGFEGQVPVRYGDISLGSPLAGFTDEEGVHLAPDCDRWGALHEAAKWIDRKTGGGGYGPGWADRYVRAVANGIGELESVILRDAMLSRGLAVGEAEEAEADDAGEEEE